MKKFFYIIVAFTFFLTGCEKKSLIQKELSQNDSYYVISLKEGNDIVLPIEPIVPHDKQPSFGGSELRNRGAKIYLTNHYFRYYPMGCTGCDSCMRCYEKEGLITYKVKEQSDNEVIADVHLTSKGKRYLIQNMANTDTTLINEASAQNIVLLTTLYTTHKAKNIIRLSEQKYLFDKIATEHCTPFATATGISPDSLKTREGRSEAYIVNMVECGYPDSESYINGYKIELRSSSSLWYDLTNNGYNLDSCKNFKNALLQHFQLTDTLASVNLYSYNWHSGKGYSLYIAGDYYSIKDTLPEYFMHSVIYQEGEGTEKKYLTLGSCYELDKIIKKHKFDHKEFERDGFYNRNVRHLDLDIVQEVVFRVKRTMSPLDQKNAEHDLEILKQFKNSSKLEYEKSGSNSILYYVRCPYIELDNYVYFIGKGCWCKSESELYTNEFSGYYPASSKMPISEPFEEICSTLSNN